MTASTPSALAVRLEALSITPAELAAIVKRPVTTVEKWIADGPDSEGQILLRVLDEDHTATLAVERVRNTVHRNMRGEAAEYAEIEPSQIEDQTPVKTTGGQPV